jgi:hypothetical protein
MEERVYGTGSELYSATYQLLRTGVDEAVLAKVSEPVYGRGCCPNLTRCFRPSALHFVKNSSNNAISTRILLPRIEGMRGLRARED